MSAFLARLRAGRPLVLDGAMGTELMARGLAGGRPPEAWNLERPEEVVAVHRAYVTAGSEAVHTNTFGANPIRLARHRLQADLSSIVSAAVGLARESGARFVIGDVGPTSEILPPVGGGDPTRWAGAFAEVAGALGDAGVDAIHVETMTDLREASCALRAVQAACPGLPALVSLSFERRPRGFFTIMGDAAADALARLRDDGATLVGANCTLGPADMGALVGGLPADLPLVVQPNAGPRADDVSGLAALVPFLRAVGGCCGTTPRFISALALVPEAVRA